MAALRANAVTTRAGTGFVPPATSQAASTLALTSTTAACLSPTAAAFSTEYSLEHAHLQ
jgi:hypothetical protein